MCIYYSVRLLWRGIAKDNTVLLFMTIPHKQIVLKILKNIFFKRNLLLKQFKYIFITACQRGSDSFYIITYYIKWVTTSWPYSKEKTLCPIIVLTRFI